MVEHHHDPSSAGDDHPHPHPHRVGIVDDHELFAGALAAALASVADFDVAVVATEPGPVVTAARDGAIDLALVDLRLGSGDDAFTTIRAISDLGGCRVWWSRARPTIARSVVRSTPVATAICSNSTRSAT